MAYSLQLILPALACSDHKNAMAELNNPHDRYECLVLRRTLPEWDGTKLDRNEHNLLGTLQFVAKALEIWFMFVATSLAYDVVMLLAKGSGGIPVGFILMHLEFADMKNILNPLMWTAPIPHRDKVRAMDRWGTFWLYLVVIMTAFLTILSNLMGPGTAVLILQTLQWTDTTPLPTHTFTRIGAYNYPFATDDPMDEPFPGCSQEVPEARNYSYTSKVYVSSLNAWTNSVVSSLNQEGYFHAPWTGEFRMRNLLILCWTAPIQPTGA